MKIVRCSWFPPPKGFAAIMLVWWLIVRENVRITDKFINHEGIHERQQKETLAVPFFIWYGMEFLVRLVQYGDWHEAYHNISFEREAYANELDMDYLSSRKKFAWVKYLKTK